MLNISFILYSAWERGGHVNLYFCSQHFFFFFYQTSPSRYEGHQTKGLLWQLMTAVCHNSPNFYDLITVYLPAHVTFATYFALKHKTRLQVCPDEGQFQISTWQKRKSSFCYVNYVTGQGEGETFSVHFLDCGVEIKIETCLCLMCPLTCWCHMTCILCIPDQCSGN